MSRKSSTPAKVFSYIRVSGDSQIDGDGPPRQREAISKYAQRSRFEVVEEFEDAGVSGTNELEDRDGLSLLYARIAGNGVRTVLVENATRLARDLLVQETILGEFRKLGVAVLGADGTDLTVADGDPTRTLIRQVLGAVAQFEKSMLVAKLRGARIRMKKKTGRCEGRKPYGSLPGEEVVLDRMKVLARKPKLGERLPLQSVADQLNDEGLRNRSGGLWTKASVWKVLNTH